MKLPRLFKWAYRSSDTGKFVTKEFAEMYPETTYRTRLWFWQGGDDD